MNDKFKWLLLIPVLIIAIGLGYGVSRLTAPDGDEGNPALQQQNQMYQAAIDEAQQSVDSHQQLLANNASDILATKGLADAYLELGMAQDEAGKANEAYRNYKNAIDSYKKYLTLSPANSDPKIDMALAYANLQMFELAERELQQVIAAAPNNQRALHTLGWIYTRVEKFDQAKTVLTQSYNVDPNSPVGVESKQFLDQISQAQTATAATTATP